MFGITQYNHVPLQNNVPLVIDGVTYDGYYISYNNYDVAIYGDVTTALVLGQMQRFYILNGNHTEQYAKLFDQGFDACFAYFVDNRDLINDRSDLPDVWG